MQFRKVRLVAKYLHMVVVKSLDLDPFARERAYNIIAYLSICFPRDFELLEGKDLAGSS